MSREYIYKIRPRGLSNVRGDQRNVREMDALVNLKPTASGLETIGQPHILKSLPEEEKHPFPQLFEIHDKLWGFGRQTLYTVDEKGNWTVKVGGLSTTGHPWSVAVFKDFAIAVNFKTRMKLYSDRLAYEVAGPAYENELCVSRAVCAWHGQLLSGNCFAYGEHRENYVRWSMVGHADQRPTRQGASGLWLDCGKIIAMRELEIGPVVYGDKGASFLRPADFPWGFGEVPIYEGIGIAGPLAVTGDKRQHIFLKANGELCTIGSNLQVTPMDYSDHMRVAARNTPTMMMEPDTRDVVMCY